MRLCILTLNVYFGFGSFIGNDAFDVKLDGSILSEFLSIQENVGDYANQSLLVIFHHFG